MKRKKVLSLILAAALGFGNFSAMVVETVFAEELVITERPKDGVTEDQPFAAGTAGSANFRIPCLVSLDNGTIVAACDARWSWAADAGGIDTIVSRSTDNGATWNYTFANYMGDNGDVANRYSTCFIDPAIATDGEKLYMIADLYPAGYAINSAAYLATPGQSLDEDGNLLLSADGRETYAYHLEQIENGTTESYYQIVENESDQVVSGYTIDAYFNIKGTGASGETVDTNLFYANSPYEFLPTDYLYLTTSEDAGETWSIPTLINVREPDEQSLLVGPGNGIVASNGRIIFTAYEHTGSSKEWTTTMYSDDGGKTWERGESVANNSSEATLAEVNGKLYMFTRGHGNAQAGSYWISDDYGESWSQKYTPTVSYNGRCQLSVIAYSENVNGKPALLLAAPSSTAGREHGKIFICLVKEDGTLEFPYEYEINKGYYAYSCLDELKDGDIGLLYESEGSRITYREITKDEIFKDVFVGNIWVEEDGAYAKRSYDMAPGSTKTLQVKTSSESAVQVSSDAPEAVEASLANGTLTLKVKENVNTLIPATVTLTDGTDTTTIQVNAVAVEDYEIVNLRTTDSVMVVNGTGDYSQEEIEGLDEKVAEIQLKDNVIPGGPRAQLAQGSADFTGSKIALSDCLYTFTAVEGENKYTVSAKTEDDTTVAINVEIGGAQIPNSTTSKNITLEKHATENTFAFNDNGKYMYFHRTDTTKLHFDRNSSIHANCYYEIYKPSQEVGENATVPGYVQVTSLEEIKGGEQYLIVAPANNGNRYVLHPSTGSSAYQHVAQIAPVEPDTHETFITITGTGEGVTSAVIGGTTYYIHVDNDEEELILEQGEEYILAGKVQAQEEGQNILNIAPNTNRGPYGPVAEIKEGTYLIGTGSHAVVNRDSGLESPSGLAMEAVNFAKGDHSAYMWEVKKVDGGYTIQDADGKYIKINGQNVTLSTEAATLSIGSKDNNGFSISSGGNFLNNWANNNNRAAAYGSDNNVWYFYQPLESVVLTGNNLGSTSITLGAVNYKVTVKEKVDLQPLKESLITLIQTADTKVKEEYEEEIWHDFWRAFISAKNTRDNSKATKEQLEEAQENLQKAMENLDSGQGGSGNENQGDQGGSENEEDAAQKELSAAKEALAQVVAGTAGKKAEDYTKESWAAYQTALQNAQAVAGKADATKEEVDAAKAALEKAVADLTAAVPTPPSGGQTGGQQPGGNNNQGGQQPGGNNNQGGQQPGGNNNQGGQQPGGNTDVAQKEVQAAKDALNAALKDAGANPASKYTKGSYEIFLNALKLAQDVSNNPNATKAQVVAAQEALQKAIAELKTVESAQPSTEKGTEFEDATGAYRFKIKNDKEAVFTGVSKGIKTVKIANTVEYAGKTFQVTEVAAKALKGDKIVTKITVGKNVKTIGASAFEGCVKLTGISLGNNTTKIGNKALKGCKVLKKVTIPKKVANLGKSVFEGCTKLSTITIKATGLKKVGKNTFKGISAKAKIKVPKKSLAAYKKLLKNKGQGKKVSVK